MPILPDDRRGLGAPETRNATRGHTRWAWDVAFRLIRRIAHHARNAYAVFGIFILCGALIAVAFTLGFAELARHVSHGSTQAFDDRVMRAMGAHQTPAGQATMLEITAMGTTSVVMMIVLISGTLLWLNQHKQSAALLVIATLGGIGLNSLLKIGFNRPRPHLFVWGTVATSSSFPSGHAMSSTIVYATVAYLVARLQRGSLARFATIALAAVVIVAICGSRMYLGVHYPSDVAAGVTVGLAWAAFCMATLEVAQLYARRNAPEMLRDERPADAPPDGPVLVPIPVAVSATPSAGRLGTG